MCCTLICWTNYEWLTSHSHYSKQVSLCRLRPSQLPKCMIITKASQLLCQIWSRSWHLYIIKFFGSLSHKKHKISHFFDINILFYLLKYVKGGPGVTSHDKIMKNDIWHADKLKLFFPDFQKITRSQIWIDSKSENIFV